MFQLGRLAESVAHSKRALALYDPVRDRSSRFVYAIDSRVICLTWLAQALLVLGYPEQARVRQGEALASARELAHPNTTAQALFYDSALHQLLGDRHEAQEQAEALSALATEQASALVPAGEVVRDGLSADGRAEDGIAVSTGPADYRATEPLVLAPLLALLADAHWRAGKPRRPWPSGRCPRPGCNGWISVDRARAAPAQRRAAAGAARSRHD